MSAVLVKLYSSTDRTLKINLQGISNADSLMQVDNCNNINWLVGHIVYSRNGVLNLLGLPPVAGEKLKAVYERGSKMMTDTAGAENIETLVKMFDESQQKIITALKDIKAEQEVLEKITFLGFHEGYHVGQVGTMRKLIGKDGAIK